MTIFIPKENVTLITNAIQIVLLAEAHGGLKQLNSQMILKVNPRHWNLIPGLVDFMFLTNDLSNFSNLIKE